MKKKIKDLTDKEAAAICLRISACMFCPLRLRFGDYCIRKGWSKHYPQEFVDAYLNKEVEVK